MTTTAQDIAQATAQATGQSSGGLAVPAVEDEDGLVQRRRARSSGTVVEVWRADALGLSDPAGNWVTLCEHGFSCHHRTRRTAVDWAAEPEIWCEEGCRDAAAKEQQRARQTESRA